MLQIADFLPLFRQLNDLKRLRVADRDGSIAERIFLRSWARLIRGDDLANVAKEETALAVVATQLAGIDARVLREAGLNRDEIFQCFERAFDGFCENQNLEFVCYLGDWLSSDAVMEAEECELPAFVQLLAKQPRAGATRPGFGRVVLEPTENHAEHCAIVAVQAVLASSLTGADAGAAFLTGLSHHLHNAYLPDAGDAGDALLGEHLKPMMATFREKSLAQLPPDLREMARQSLDSVFRADTPESKAFQIADSLDRVLEMEWHARSASFTLSVALDEMDIIHPGPVQAYQLEIMRAAGFK